MQELVVLVDPDDRSLGVAGKMEVHSEGNLHRAHSVFVFDSDGRMLLQKRAIGKYHSGGLWSNACCGHPRPGESVEAAASRRLMEEMGVDCQLRKLFEFVYRVDLNNGMTEHEYDHVLVGTFDGKPVLNSDEVDDWRWIEPEALLSEIESNPEQYTYWFKAAIDQVLRRFQTDKVPA
jgi:isopentenyl-diphosphate delta-isomerase